jgi:hypothetical protein
VENLVYLLPLVACPVMMGVMMWMMRGHHTQHQPANPDVSTQEEIAVLRAEIATLRAQQNQPAQGDADQPARP